MATFATLDPARGQEIAQVAHAGVEDVQRAVAAAREAFEGPWAALPASARGRLIGDLADAVDAHAEELAQIESLDNGKPVKLAQYVDVLGTGGTPALLRGLAHQDRGQRSAGDRTQHALLHPPRARRRVRADCALELPAVMAAWKIAPALAAGCTIVLKPAEQTPLSALRLGELALEVGFPPGVLNVLTGDGSTGAALVDHPGVDKIAFTGSTAVGREIGAKAGRALKRMTLELGGKSPNVILPDADIEAAIKGSYQAIYFNSGQACNAGSRLFVPADRYDEVIAALAERAAATRLGPGLDTATQLGPLISAEQRERVMGYIDSGRAEGAELVDGPHPPAALDDSGGYFVAPTLFSVTSDDSRIAREEYSALSWWPRRTTPWRRSLSGPTTPTTAWRQGCGRKTFLAPIVSPACCGPVRSTSTTGAAPIPLRPLAASRRRDLGASTATMALTLTLRPRPSGPLFSSALPSSCRSSMRRR